MSVDKVKSDSAHIYPVKFLHASGLPLAHLTFKSGCPLMLLHNLNPAMVCVMAHAWCCWRLELWFLGVGFWVVIMLEIIFIPRTSCDPSEALPIQLCCHQIPVHPAFVMTINKAQGVTVQLD